MMCVAVASPLSVFTGLRGSIWSSDFITGEGAPGGGVRLPCARTGDSCVPKVERPNSAARVVMDLSFMVAVARWSLMSCDENAFSWGGLNGPRLDVRHSTGEGPTRSCHSARTRVENVSYIVSSVVTPGVARQQSD